MNLYLVCRKDNCKCVWVGGVGLKSAFFCERSGGGRRGERITPIFTTTFFLAATFV